MKDKIKKNNKTTYPQSKDKAQSNKENQDQSLLKQDILENDNNLGDLDLGNQMDDDILIIDEDALENPNPTKQDGEENERPGGGLRK